MSIGNHTDVELASELNSVSGFSGILKVVSGEYTNPDAVFNAISYVASHAIGCNGIGCSAIAEEAIYDFHRIKALYGKTDGKQLKHIVVAFNPSTSINEESIHWIAWYIAAYFHYASYQVFYGIHETQIKKRTAYHIHLIVNTVSFATGLRLNWFVTDKDNFIQYIESLPYGFSISSVNSYY